VRPGVLHLGCSDAVHRLVVGGHRGGHPTAVPGAAGRGELLAAGAPGAKAGMRALRVPQVEIHPPALREGVIRQGLDTLDETAQIDRSAQDAPEQLGRLTTFEARCTG
jgi:exopolyphosphatase / guanosine-5'-triphosphate,3'-diphosphate pyrophosphatase